MAMLSPELLKLERHGIMQCTNHLMIRQLMHWHVKQISCHVLLKDLPMLIARAMPKPTLKSLCHGKTSVAASM